MKKYKLIKTYPGSPKLNEIIVESMGTFFIVNPENFPEFWQEIVENDYEILSFKYGNRCPYYYTLRNCGLYSSSECKKDFYTLEEQLSNVKKVRCRIESVKRLSDGEIFTIGDNTNGGIIQSFDIWKCSKNESNFKDTLQITVSKDDDWWNLKEIKHITRPIFKTEDGVDIYETDNFYVLDITSDLLENIQNEWKPIQTTINNRNNLDSNFPSKNQKFFSTKEAAEEYIIMNKPCLAINDVMNITYTLESRRVYMEKLKELVKSRL